MGGKSATSQISSLYRLLWGIPIRGRLLSLAIAAYLAASLTLAFLIGFSPYSILIPVGFLLSILVNRLSEWGLGDLGLINLRRMNQLSIINAAFIILGSILSLTPVGVMGFTILVSIGAFLRVTVYLTLSGKRILRATPLLLASMLLEAAPLYILQQASYGSALAKSYLIGGCLAAAMIFILKRLIDIRRLPALDYVSGILAYLLDDRRDWISEIAENLDDESDVQLDVLVFRERNGNPEAAIIIPTFHPGPFKDFGSSGLQYRIYDELSRLGIETIFFKGLSNHENNLISEDDCRLIIRELKRLFADNSSNLSYYSHVGEPARLRDGRVKGLVLRLGEAKLVFLTTHPDGMEDIPRSIARDLADESIIAVDCHNSFSRLVKDLDEDSLESASRILKKAEMLDPDKSSPLILGYARSMLEGYSRVDGIGDLGISAITIMLESSPIAIISLDGNNCLPEVRQLIIEKVKSLGFGVVEVLTTDTHIVNGLRFGGMGYHPLGEVIPAEELAEKAVEAVRRAMESAKPMEVAWARLRFMGVKVKAPSFLGEAAKKARIGLLTFFSTLLFTAILAAAI
ncbi:MAG: hypothetical protein DRN59_01285 [Thaumarchaeota archaeon]|nr:MAG: hypothetical protein DRN59_01285 [Nitrososphaerota archaeon]